MLSQTTGNRWTAERTIEHGRLFGCSLPPIACFGESDPDGVLVGIRCLHTQNGGLEPLKLACVLIALYDGLPVRRAD